MFLVHVTLHSSDTNRQLPEGCDTLIQLAAASEDRVEHVVAHPYARPSPVIGVYVLADRREEAADCGQRACQRAIDRFPALRYWKITAVEVSIHP